MVLLFKNGSLETHLLNQVYFDEPRETDRFFIGTAYFPKLHDTLYWSYKKDSRERVKSKIPTFSESKFSILFQKFFEMNEITWKDNAVCRLRDDGTIVGIGPAIYLVRCNEYLVKETAPSIMKGQSTEKKAELPYDAAIENITTKGLPSFPSLKFLFQLIIGEEEGLLDTNQKFVLQNMLFDGEWLAETSITSREGKVYLLQYGAEYLRKKGLLYSYNAGSEGVLTDLRKQGFTPHLLLEGKSKTMLTLKELLSRKPALTPLFLNRPIKKCPSRIQNTYLGFGNGPGPCFYVSDKKQDIISIQSGYSSGMNTSGYRGMIELDKAPIGALSAADIVGAHGSISVVSEGQISIDKMESQ